MYGSTILGWASYITVAILLCALVPLLKKLLFSVLILLSINLMRSAGFEVSLNNQRPPRFKINMACPPLARMSTSPP